jgi:hypothetical protein
VAADGRIEFITRSVVKAEHKNPEWLCRILKDAMERFNASTDRILLEDAGGDDGKNYGCVGECAITHRFAVQLEKVLFEEGYPNEIAPISIDCEYNRRLGKLKEQHVTHDLKDRLQKIKNRRLKEDPVQEGRYSFSVFPDIVIHQRGKNELNLLVIEVKRASNSFDDELDNIKLHLFTAPDDGSGYGYILGASVIAFDNDELGKRRLHIGRLFVDGRCRYRAEFLANELVTHEFLKTPECGYG